LVKVEGKVVPFHAMKAYGRSRGIASLIPTAAIYIAMTSRLTTVTLLAYPLASAKQKLLYLLLHLKIQGNSWGTEKLCACT